ncbi:hypothetical protein OSTOST_19972, partial [Ostertagia ostertagi]
RRRRHRGGISLQKCSFLRHSFSHNLSDIIGLRPLKLHLKREMNPPPLVAPSLHEEAKSAAQIHYVSLNVVVMPLWIVVTCRNKLALEIKKNTATLEKLPKSQRSTPCTFICSGKKEQSSTATSKNGLVLVSKIDKQLI